MDTKESAAVKLVKLTTDTTDKERKTIDKEMRIHSLLKHPNILEFIDAIIIEAGQKNNPYPSGIYMLLELAAGGDLFDKIGASTFVFSCERPRLRRAPSQCPTSASRSTSRTTTSGR